MCVCVFFNFDVRHVINLIGQAEFVLEGVLPENFPFPFSPRNINVREHIVLLVKGSFVIESGGLRVWLQLRSLNCYEDDTKMDFGHPTAEWNQLYDRYYRKREVYAMLWDKMDLSKYMVAAAPFGGPLAFVRDEKKILLIEQDNQLKPMVQIYSSAGKQLGAFLWDKGKIAGMGWTEFERLLIVLEDGTIMQYTLQGKLYNQFSLGKECAEQQVQDCRIWGTGFVVMTYALQFFTVNSLEEPRCRHLANPGLSQPPTSWIIIEPQYTLSKNVEVLIATKDGTILVLDAEGCQDQLLTNGPFTKLAVSPTGKILACFTQSGNLNVISSDFSRNLSEFSTKSKIPPQQLVWCGTDSVVLYWEKIVLMVGPYGDWIKYSYEEPLHLIPECDGVRIITNSACEFLHRVPNVTEDIFKIGSTSPSAMLYDAYEHYEKKSPKADENIRSIKKELSDAVDACIEAAGHEFDHRLQRQLLKAASFGKCFLDFYYAESFVEMAKALRVLNAVRHFEIGIPLTYLQYKQQGPEILIERLIARHHHLVAWRICKYLDIKGERVLVHWACAKVKSSVDEASTCNLIVKKLSALPGISFAEVASTAYKHGRPELATRLLEHEPRAADQVPLLISMQEVEMALSKAIESGDTDLVYLVLLHIKRTKSLQDFFRIIRNKPVAVDLLIAYCKQQDRELLKDIYYHSNQTAESAQARVHEAYESYSLADRVRQMEIALRMYRESKDHAFETKATEDQIRLLLQQRELETELKAPFVDNSLSDTLFKLIQMGQERKASSFKSQFKVPDSRFWWIKIRALADKKEWDALFLFAKEKKSPIGYRPFADVCIEQGAKGEALTYIPRIADAKQRIDYFLRVGSWNDAADVAGKELKDPEVLMQLRNRCTNTEHKSYIEMLLRKLQQ